MFVQQVPGPCGACGKVESDAYRQGFTKCGTCDAVWCKPCAIPAMTKQDQHQSFLRAYHEVSNSHTWVDSREECDFCSKQPCNCGGKHCNECLADVRTYRCDCGVVTCQQCLHVHAWTDLAPHADATTAAPDQPQAETLLALPSGSSQHGVVTQSRPASSCTLCYEDARKVCSCGGARCEDCFRLEGVSLLHTLFEMHTSQASRYMLRSGPSDGRRYQAGMAGAGVR